MQLIWCKDTTKSLLPEIFVFTIFTVNITFINAARHRIRAATRQCCAVAK